MLQLFDKWNFLIANPFCDNGFWALVFQRVSNFWRAIFLYHWRCGVRNQKGVTIKRSSIWPRNFLTGSYTEWWFFIYEWHAIVGAEKKKSCDRVFNPLLCTKVCFFFSQHFVPTDLNQPTTSLKYIVSICMLHSFFQTIFFTAFHMGSK